MRYRVSVDELQKRQEMFLEGLLLCRCCKGYLPVGKFRRLGLEPNNYGHRYYCIECERIKDATRRDRQTENAKQRNKRLKNWIAKLAGGKCQRCGYNEFLSGMEFHHVFPSLKKFSPTVVIYSKPESEILEEIDKCCLLCSCCHNAFEIGEWKADFVKRDGLGWTINFTSDNVSHPK